MYVTAIYSCNCMLHG